MKARVIPWSSTVVTGIMLVDENSLVVGQMALHNVRGCTDENRKAIMMNMAQLVADAINGAPASSDLEKGDRHPEGMQGERGVEKMR